MLDIMLEFAIVTQCFFRRAWRLKKVGNDFCKISRMVAITNVPSWFLAFFCLVVCCKVKKFFKKRTFTKYGSHDQRFAMVDAEVVVRFWPFTIPAYSSSKQTFYFLFNQNQSRFTRVIVSTNLEQRISKIFANGGPIGWYLARVLFWWNTTGIPNFIQIGQGLDIAAIQSI